MAASTPIHRILGALSRADYGQLLLEHFDEATEAAQAFRSADDSIRALATKDTFHAAGVLRIYLLCREAEAALRLNRWNDANDRLLIARDLATNLAAKDYLTSYVYRQMAWAAMIQWRLADARAAFVKSNGILAELIRRGYGADNGVASSTTVPAAGETPMHISIDPTPPSALVTGPVLDEDGAFAEEAAFRLSENTAAQIAYLHNLHGLAMASRFQGSSTEAAKRYRQLYARLVQTQVHYRTMAGYGDQDQQFILREINGLERLGDCNLFADPQVRNVSEAVDDYRRALASVSRLPASQRERWEVLLAYKQAWALALPSAVQDCEFAVALCQRADRVVTDQKIASTGQIMALGQLGTKVVRVLTLGKSDLKASVPVMGEINSGGDARPGTAISELRTALLDYRDAIGATPHRDQLETGLFAAKVLLDYVQNPTDL